MFSCCCLDYVMLCVACWFSTSNAIHPLKVRWVEVCRSMFVVQLGVIIGFIEMGFATDLCPRRRGISPLIGDQFNRGSRRRTSERSWWLCLQFLMTRSVELWPLTCTQKTNQRTVCHLSFGFFSIEFNTIGVLCNFCNNNYYAVNMCRDFTIINQKSTWLEYCIYFGHKNALSSIKSRHRRLFLGLKKSNCRTCRESRICAFFPGIRWIN